MLVVLLVASPLLQLTLCEVTPVTTEVEPFLPCIANITRQHLAQAKSLVFLSSYSDTDLLMHLHSMEVISFNRRSCRDPTNTNLAYMLVVKDVIEFKQCMEDLAADTNWNPSARFLAVIKPLKTEDLSQIFDIFLHLRVKDIVVVNGTLTAELYTYNPYEHFACGNYYTRFIYYGGCSAVIADIYPPKAVTGLRRCSLRVSIPHWPPYAFKPDRIQNLTGVMGTEQYIFQLMSEIEHFIIKYNFEFDPESFSMVYANLSVSGPMEQLARNHTDVMLGGLLLLPLRALAFTYVSGHLDYLDDIRLMVKMAGTTPAWKDIYFSFSLPVWALLLLSLILYSTLVAILLKSKDKGHVLLALLDGLLIHGARFCCRQSVKCVILVWMIFAYMVNSFYTTTLMSLTTRPSSAYQISNERAVIERRVKPCISQVMDMYMKSEGNYATVSRDVEAGSKMCEKLIESVRTVSTSEQLYTVVLYSIYTINKQKLYDEYGRSPVYSFRDPYAKVIYAIYFNKGSPMMERLHALALRIRESGVPEKSLRDHYYTQTLKYRFRPLQFAGRFAVPWYLYGAGLLVSAATLVVELASLYHTVQFKLDRNTPTE